MRKRASLAGVCGGLVGSAFIACSSFSSTEVVPPDGAATRPDTQVESGVDRDGGILDEASGPDAGSSLDAGALRCPLENLLYNGDFENALIGWQAGTGSSSETAQARSGRSAAKICADPKGGYFELRSEGFNLSPASHVRLLMWAHVADVKVPLVSDFGARITISVPNYDSASFASGIPKGNSWTCLEGEYRGPAVGFAVGGQTSSQDGGKEACVVVDDMQLTRVTDSGVPPECRCPTRM